MYILYMYVLHTNDENLPYVNVYVVTFNEDDISSWLKIEQSTKQSMQTG